MASAFRLNHLRSQSAYRSTRRQRVAGAAIAPDLVRKSWLLPQAPRRPVALIACDRFPVCKHVDQCLIFRVLVIRVAVARRMHTERHKKTRFGKVFPARLNPLRRGDRTFGISEIAVLVLLRNVPVSGISRIWWSDCPARQVKEPTPRERNTTVWSSVRLRRCEGYALAPVCLEKKSSGRVTGTHYSGRCMLNR